MAADARHFKRAHRRLLQASQDSLPGLVFDLVESKARAAGRRPKYVQVGAHDGFLDDMMYSHVVRGTWDALLLEPATEPFARLQTLHKDRPWVKCLNVGASSKSGTLTLHTLDPQARDRYPKWVPGAASLDRDTFFRLMSMRRDNADPNDIVEEKIDLRRLDDILVEQHALDADGLIVDVEGHEADVFAGARFDQFSPEFILYENVHLDDATDRRIRDQLEAANYVGFRLSKDTLCLNPSLLAPGLEAALANLGAVSWQNLKS
ncbi:MAG: FkbM family methyltransferase [Boseongicola sp.]|nr:MAG: FkbM family methyltransferase [Boseongicola sp.]